MTNNTAIVNNNFVDSQRDMYLMLRKVLNNTAIKKEELVWIMNEELYDEFTNSIIVQKYDGNFNKHLGINIIVKDREYGKELYVYELAIKSEVKPEILKLML
jgi:hypothetical protein